MVSTQLSRSTRPFQRNDPEPAPSPKLDIAIVGGTDSGYRISVLHTFKFRAGDATPVLPQAERRLLAFLALRKQPAARLLVAGTLWPDATEPKAASNLRSTLWRLKRVVGDAIDITDVDLALRSNTSVDLREAKALAQRLVNPSTGDSSGDESAAAVDRLSGELLPGWYGDWILIEGREWHQLRLHALEALAERLKDKRRWAEAVSAALAAAQADPLRESAHGALIKVFLAEGNQSEALDEFSRYRALIRSELGVEPTRQLTDLVGNLRRRSTDH